MVSWVCSCQNPSNWTFQKYASYTYQLTVSTEVVSANHLDSTLLQPLPIFSAPLYGKIPPSCLNTLSHFNPPLPYPSLLPCSRSARQASLLFRTPGMILPQDLCRSLDIRGFLFISLKPLPNCCQVRTSSSSLFKAVTHLPPPHISYLLPLPGFSPHHLPPSDPLCILLANWTPLSQAEY